ncbi:MAG: metallophosphoesterase [Enhygromyxa sp.]
MDEYRLSILHVSDLHARSFDVGEVPKKKQDARRRHVESEAVSRNRVLGDEWDENLRAMYPQGSKPDLVCFTGDVADWGLSAEYVEAQKFFERLCAVLSVARNRIYVIPGNHDIHRPTRTSQWKKLRDLMAREADAVSRWLVGGSPPRDVDKNLLNAVLKRSSRFWTWVEGDLGRPELLPATNKHGRLGYCHQPDLGLPFSVSVIGLDSAWLAGQENERGLLWLTRHQREMLLCDRGNPRPGFRLALMHHPLGELGDADQSRRDLAEWADLLLHGHQHDPVASCQVDADGRTARVLAAGCVFEGYEGSQWKNGCQRIDVVLDGDGRPRRADIRFRAWSPRGHWHADSSLYKSQAPDGRLSWSAWNGSRRSAAARIRSPQRSVPKDSPDPDDAPPEQRLLAVFEQVPSAFACLAAGSNSTRTTKEQLATMLLGAESLVALTMDFVRAMERAEKQSDLAAATSLMEIFGFAAPIVAHRCAALNPRGDRYQSTRWSHPQSIEPSAAAIFDRNVAFLAGSEFPVPRYYVETGSIPHVHIDQNNSVSLIESDVALRDPEVLERVVSNVEKHLRLSPAGSLDERLLEANSELQHGKDRVTRYTVIKDADNASVQAFMELLGRVRLAQIVASPPSEEELRQEDFDLRKALKTLHDVYYRILREHGS